MNTFLGLLAAVVSLVTVFTLSILELWVIPWPVILILLLLTLWISQRLIDRFNPSPLESSEPASAEVFSKPLSELGKPEQNPLRYRGQVYAESDRVPEKATEEGEEVPSQCYRGIRLQTPTPIAAPPDAEQSPQLSYRGVKRSPQA